MYKRQQDTNAVITKQQSAMLKESDKKGELTFPMVRMLLEKEKPVERKVVIKTERINSYFPDTYSTDDIEKIISVSYTHLDVYKRQREDYIKYQAEFDKNVGHYYQTAENPTWDEAISLFGENQYPGPMGPRNETRPCGLYESLLKRVMPYTLRGDVYKRQIIF